MRASLFLTVATAALSLCLSQGYAQNAGRDEAGGQARPGHSETAGPQGKNQGGEEARKGQERHGERAQDQNRERAESKGAKESERQGLTESGKPGQSAKDDKDEERRGKQGAMDEERHGKQGVTNEERRGKQGAANEERGRKGAKHGAKQEPGKETRGAKEADTQDKTGRAESQKNERTGAIKPGEENRGAQNERERAQRAEQRGETDRDRQQGRDVFGRSPDADRTRGAETTPRGEERDRTRGAETTPRGEERDRFGRTDGDERQRGAAREERGGVRLSERDQNRVRDIIERRGVRSISRSDFDVHIGAVVPPNVQFYPLPPDVAAIVPQYRGYDFVRVEDQIAIIDPGTREVVTMLGEGGGPPAMYGYDERGGGVEGGYDRREGGRYGSARRDEGSRRDRGESYGYAPRVRLDNRQERALYRGVMQEAKQNLKQVCVRVGDRVPEFVDIEPVPRQIAAETPDVARFDYFVLNDQVVLVDPDSRKVVDIIEEPR